MADKFTAEDRRALCDAYQFLSEMRGRALAGNDAGDSEKCARLFRYLVSIKRLLAPGGPLDGVESDPEREAFEAWARDEHPVWTFDWRGTDYSTVATDHAWKGWQARAAREGGK